MSIDTCKSCCRWVDTDDDCGAYSLTTENGEYVSLEFAMCPSCREAPDAFREALKITTSTPLFMKYVKEHELAIIREYAGKELSEQV